MTGTTQTASQRASGAPGDHLPGDGAMWVMVLGDLVIFGSYFLIFMVHRAMAPQEFLETQQHLNLNVGVLNTLVLLKSSWFVARSVVAARSGDHDAAVRLTYAGGACGALFIGIKAYEWTTKVAEGHTMAGSEFFMFYYMLTGVHLFHVTLGLLIMGIVVRELRNLAAPDVDGRVQRDLLAHGRPSLGRHLRPALRDEVSGLTTTNDSPERSTRATTAAWLALSAITVVSWRLAPGHSGGHASASVPITVAAILLGFVKGRVIIRYFMEVRGAPGWLRHSTDLWLAALWGAVLVIYLW